MNKHSKIPMIVSICVMVFLYAPIIVLVIYSFNDSRYPGSWHGFTMKWYLQLIEARTVETRDIWRATCNTFIVAFSATGISMVLGTMAAWALYRYSSKLQKFHQALIYAPLVVPDLLMGISLLMLFVNFSMKLGLMTIIIAHTTFCISYVALVVLGRLQDFDHSLVDAARDLGANNFNVGLRVLLPLLGPGIMAGGLLAFTLSVDDFVVTFFTSGPGSTTLPVQVYSMMRRGTPTLINALSVILIVITFSVVIFSQRILQKRAQNSHSHL
jgi:spermidine/putrescine transport system permease protein